MFTDLCSGRIRSFAPQLRRVRGARPSRLQVGTPISFGEDSRGRLYVTSFNGPVYRFVQK